MFDKEQLALLKQSGRAWNEWRQQNKNAKPDLSGANLHGANLVEANLSGADLVEADLVEDDLVGADLSAANLSAANLSGANLELANLHGADLHGADLFEANLLAANLSGAILVRAHLGGADLSGANLSEAYLRETTFGDTNLRNLKGLDNCHHFGPSIIDHRTIAKSGPLPLPFLRGCGLPDHFIEFLPSLFNDAIQFYSCFISYSTKDQAFAERLYADLQSKGVRCWFAPHAIQGGKKIHEQIDEAIRLYDRLLLILSEASMNSEWVKTEIANARQKELNKRQRVLFPIGLVPFETIRGWKNFDADTGKDSAREIREYFIPDFTDWKNHDHFQKAFDRLLRDLKPENQ